MLAICRVVVRSVKQQQQHTEEHAAEERRRSGSAASTSGSSGGTAAATSLLDRLLHPGTSSAGARGLATSATPRAVAEGQARNTAVDVKYKPFLDAWDRGFVDAEEEPGYFLEVVQGQVPAELSGTLFRWAARGWWCGWRCFGRCLEQPLTAQGSLCLQESALLQRFILFRSKVQTASISFPCRNGPGRFRVGDQPFQREPDQFWLQLGLMNATEPNPSNTWAVTCAIASSRRHSTTTMPTHAGCASLQIRTTAMG